MLLNFGAGDLVGVFLTIDSSDILEVAGVAFEFTTQLCQLPVNAAGDN